MAMNYDPIIPKTDLIDGAYYQGRCRNASTARWNGKEQQFYHWRHKFGSTYIETIKAPEDEKRYDVFVAEKQVEPKEAIPMDGYSDNIVAPSNTQGNHDDLFEH